jgi:divalent metal cation (Fe/Co/Zn/Cd) transporter
MIIAGYIFSVSYVSLKRSSLILVDSWQNPKVTELVKKIIEEKIIHEQVKTRSVLLRPTGIVSQAELHIEVDGSKLLTEVESLSSEIGMEVRSKIPTIERVSVVPHSSSPSPTRTAKSAAPFRKWVSSNKK